MDGKIVGQVDKSIILIVLLVKEILGLVLLDCLPHLSIPLYDYSSHY